MASFQVSKSHSNNIIHCSFVNYWHIHLCQGLESSSGQLSIPFLDIWLWYTKQFIPQQLPLWLPLKILYPVIKKRNFKKENSRTDIKRSIEEVIPNHYLLLVSDWVTWDAENLNVKHKKWYLTKPFYMV